MARWYRAYEGTTSDPKLGEVSLVSGASRSVVIATWHAILEACATANAGGVFDLNARRVAAMLGEQISLIQSVFDGLAEVGMVDGDTVLRWKDRQFESDKSAARTRAWRERRRTSHAVAEQSGDGDKTSCDVTETTSDGFVTSPYTETDTETDISTDVEIGEVAISPAPRFDLNEAVRAWNDMAARIGLAQVQRVTEPRRRALKARLAECDGIEGWHAALAKIEASPFLTGNNDRGWRADFDFVTRESSFTKIMEGKYDRSEQVSAAIRAAQAVCESADDEDLSSIFKSFQIRAVPD